MVTAPRSYQGGNLSIRWEVLLHRYMERGGRRFESGLEHYFYGLVCAEWGLSTPYTVRKIDPFINITYTRDWSIPFLIFLFILPVFMGNDLTSVTIVLITWLFRQGI